MSKCLPFKMYADLPLASEERTPRCDRALAPWRTTYCLAPDRWLMLLNPTSALIPVKHTCLETLCSFGYLGTVFLGPPLPSRCCTPIGGLPLPLLLLWFWCSPQLLLACCHLSLYVFLGLKTSKHPKFKCVFSVFYLIMVFFLLLGCRTHGFI